MKRYFLVILFGFFVQLASGQIFDVDTIQYTGPIDNRINLVILGDGYTIGEMSQFTDDVRDFSRALFQEAPFSQYKSYFNLYAIETPSAESGASHPRTGNDDHDPYLDHPFLLVDNYFGSTFDFDGIHRLLVAPKISEITNVLANNFPSYDIAIIIVNTVYWGGAGGEFATASAKNPNIIIHEIGHSFSGLADEYYAGDQFFVESANMTKENDPDEVKWKNWMNYNGINILSYEGSAMALNWYHPHIYCKMGNSSARFCSVCQEGTIEKIHSLVSPIDSYFPSNEENIDLSESTKFGIKLNKPNPNTLEIKWYIDSELIIEDMEDLLIAPNYLEPGEHQIQVVIEDNSSLLRIDEHGTIHAYSILWTIDASASSVVDVSEEDIKIEIFPNPTDDKLNINMSGKLGDEMLITVFNIGGIELLNKTAKKGFAPMELNLQNLATGVYILKFQLISGHVITRKIIKE